MTHDPKPDRDVSPRAVRGSEVTLIRHMTQLDANSLGNVHGGTIMREVDNAAGTAAARHAGTSCVTASIDELSFLAPVHVGDLLIVKAKVNAVGETSLEVGVRVEAEPSRGGQRRHTTSAYLVFVAIDDQERPVRVPPIVCETEEERRRQAQAEIRRNIRKERIHRLGSWRPEPVDEAGAS